MGRRPRHQYSYIGSKYIGGGRLALDLQLALSNLLGIRLLFEGHLEHAVLEERFDLLGVGAQRDGQGAGYTTVVPLSAVNHLSVILRDIVTIGLDMEAAVVTHALIDGDGQCVLVDAWKVDEDVEVLGTLHDVGAKDRRELAHLLV